MAFLVGLPFSSFIGPFIPDILAQKDLRRARRLPFAFFSVTAVDNFDPGLALRYAETPFFVIPAPDSVERKCPFPSAPLRSSKNSINDFMFACPLKLVIPVSNIYRLGITGIPKYLNA